MQAKSLLTIFIVTMGCVSPNAAHAFQWQVGFAKTDVTPGEPIRLSGYASRGQAFDSVADPLHARVMTMGRPLATPRSACMSSVVQRSPRA